jgi:hypothetical protein
MMDVDIRFDLIERCLHASDSLGDTCLGLWHELGSGWKAECIHGILQEPKRASFEAAGFLDVISQLRVFLIGYGGSVEISDSLACSAWIFPLDPNRRIIVLPDRTCGVVSTHGYVAIPRQNLEQIMFAQCASRSSRPAAVA